MVMTSPNWSHTRCDKKGETPSPLCFFPHRRDERGETLSAVFLSHTDVTRGGLPCLAMFHFTQTQREGENPLRHVLFHADATRRRNTPFHCLSFHRLNAKRESLSPWLLNIYNIN